MSFAPPAGLRNSHVQTILSSMGPRRYFVKKKFKSYAEQQHYTEIDCGDGIRLAGYLNRARLDQHADKLVVLIHGWEGKADSTYILSASQTLLDSGVDVFRLNLRDHGNTHHLNKNIFNSTLIDEVISAVTWVHQHLSQKQTYLAGFSLGGNFSLRCAAKADPNALQLEKVIAFCPVIDPKTSNRHIQSRKNFLYHAYFVRKWRRSLLIKNKHFPEYRLDSALQGKFSLDDMNHYLIPKYTKFEEVDAYFNAYAITGNTLDKTLCDCHLVFAKDDMMIPIKDAQYIADNPSLNIEISDHGGHCGFLNSLAGDSWLDQRLLELVSY